MSSIRGILLESTQSFAIVLAMAVVKPTIGRGTAATVAGRGRSHYLIPWMIYYLMANIWISIKRSPTQKTLNLPYKSVIKKHSYHKISELIWVHPHSRLSLNIRDTSWMRQWIMRINHAQCKRLIPSVNCGHNSNFVHMLLQLGIKSIIGSHLLTL